MNSPTPAPRPADQIPLTAHLPRNVWVATAGSLLTDISSEMAANLLPLFLTNTLGVRTAVIGLIEGVAETTAGLLRVASGRLSDRLGRRKWLTVGGYAVSTAAKPFLAFAASWTTVLAVRFADRMGKGIRSAPRDALIADSIGPHRRGAAFGLHRAGDTLGAAIGLLLTMAIVWRLQGGALRLQPGTYRTLVLWSVLPAVLAVLVLAVGLRETGRAAHDRTNVLVPAGPLSSPFRRFLLVVSLFALGNSADAFIILRAQERGLNVLGILAMSLSFNLVYALVAGPAGIVSDRIGRRRVLTLGWFAYAAIYLGFAVARTGWQVWMLYLLYGLYYGLTEGVSKACVADLVAPEQRGSAYGLYNGIVGMVALPASLLAGVLWQGIGRWAGWGPSAPFLMGAALALTAVWLLWRWVPAPAR